MLTSSLLRSSLARHCGLIRTAATQYRGCKTFLGATSVELAAKGVGRRQFLVESGGAACLAIAQQPAQATQRSMSSASNGVGSLNPDELKAAVKQIVPALTGDKAKGQAGKIGTIGGCREYTGAPYFASSTVLKVGADLSHVFCTENAATVIKSYSPELIVHPYLADEDFRRTMAMAASTAPKDSGFADASAYDQDQLVKNAFTAIDHWLDRFDCVIVGPGLGRDQLVHDTVTEVLKALRKRNKPMVIDADGLYIVTHNLDLVKGYKNVILTPNKHEYKRLADALGVDMEGKDKEDHLTKVAKKLEGPTVVQKGAKDGICNGEHLVFCTESGSKRRAGGQGDVLSGCIAAFSAWAKEYEQEKGQIGGGLPPLMVAAYGACLTARHSQAAAFAKKRRSMVAEDVIEEVGATVDRLFDGGDAE